MTHKQTLDVMKCMKSDVHLYEITNKQKIFTTKGHGTSKWIRL